MRNLLVREGTRMVLFNSPIYKEYYEDGEDYLPPLGQGYIATSLGQHNISVELVDCVHERLGVEDIVEIINTGSFSYLGFNVFSINLTLIKEIIVGIQRNVHIFLGGKAIEHLWKDIISWKLPQTLSLIIGEGENIIPAIIMDNCKEIPIYCEESYKVYSVTKNSCYYPSNLDDTFLDRRLFKGRELLNRYGRLESSIIASRGCIYNCAFCGGAMSANPNTTVRTRGIHNIALEIKDILQQCPEIGSIRFLDDLFLKDRDSIINACKLFELFPRLHWRCMAHVNSFSANLDLIDDIKRAGCEELFIGIESGSIEIRNLIHKLGTPQDVIKVVGTLLREGIHIKGYFICGFPSETEDHLLETFKLAKTLHHIADTTSGNFRSVVFQFRPYHGTELFNQIAQHGEKINYSNPNKLTSTKRQYNFSAGNFSNVSDEVLEQYIRQIRQLNE